MFILDSTTVIIFFVAFAITYLVLHFSENSNFESTESKIITSLMVGIIMGIITGYFITNGNESLLSENFVDAGTKFGTVSGMESIKEMANI